jgi:hypothetical protein
LGLLWVLTHGLIRLNRQGVVALKGSETLILVRQSGLEPEGLAALAPRAKTG